MIVINFNSSLQYVVEMVTNMRCLAVLILFATHSCFCDQVATSNHNKQSTLFKLGTKKMDAVNNTYCNKIKCPTEEERTCVKLINKRGYGSKNIYIMVINKCEIEHIKCHKELEAKVVPIKNCLDKHAVKSRSLAQKKRIKRSPDVATKTHHNNHPGSRRNRRKFVSSFNKSQKKINYSSLYFGAHNRRDFSEVEALKETEEEFSKVRENAASNEDDNIQNNVIFQIRQIDNGDESANEESFVGDAEFEAKSDKESQENVPDGDIGNVDETQNVEAEDQKSDSEVALIKIDEIYGDSNNSNNRIESQESNEQDKKRVESEIKELNETNTEKNDNDSKERKIMEKYELSQEENKEVFSSELNKNNTTDVKKSNTSNKTTHQAFSDHPDVIYYDNVDMEQYNKDCPSVCPARDLMICARSITGIYYTYLSVCHLRMYNCKNPSNKNELVSRQPCMLTSPIWTDMMFIKGRVREPNDDDVVLRYIQCRENDNAGDPRCNI